MDYWSYQQTNVLYSELKLTQRKIVIDLIFCLARHDL